MGDLWFGIFLLMGAGFLVLIGYLLHRLMIWMEERGWIYYREKPDFKTGIKGLFIDVDRLTRPQSVHVLEAKEPRRQVVEDKKGET